MASSPVLKYAWSEETACCSHTLGEAASIAWGVEAGVSLGEQGISRPALSGGVFGKLEASLTMGAQPELSLTLRREQDQLIAIIPSRILRRMPKPYLFYPTGLQTFQQQKWLLKVASGQGNSIYLLILRRLGSSCLAQVSPTEDPWISTFSCFQPSLLPPSAKKKNS